MLPNLFNNRVPTFVVVCMTLKHGCWTLFCNPCFVPLFTLRRTLLLVYIFNLNKIFKVLTNKSRLDAGGESGWIIALSSMYMYIVESWIWVALLFHQEIPVPFFPRHLYIISLQANSMLIKSCTPSHNTQMILFLLSLPSSIHEKVLYSLRELGKSPIVSDQVIWPSEGLGSMCKFLLQPSHTLEVWERVICIFWPSSWTFRWLDTHVLVSHQVLWGFRELGERLKVSFQALLSQQIQQGCCTATIHYL